MKNLKKELEELDSKAKDLTVEFNSVKWFLKKEQSGNNWFWTFTFT
jgi:hypothetical protein